MTTRMMNTMRAMMAMMMIKTMAMTFSHFAAESARAKKSGVTGPA